MRDKRKKILADPEEYRQEQIEIGFPRTSMNCPKRSSRKSIGELEDVVASVDPAALREEIHRSAG